MTDVEFMFWLVNPRAEREAMSTDPENDALEIRRYVAEGTPLCCAIAFSCDEQVGIGGLAAVIRGRRPDGWIACWDCADEAYLSEPPYLLADKIACHRDFRKALRQSHHAMEEPRLTFKEGEVEMWVSCCSRCRRRVVLQFGVNAACEVRNEALFMTWCSGRHHYMPRKFFRKNKWDGPPRF